MATAMSMELSRQGIFDVGDSRSVEDGRRGSSGNPRV